MSSNTSISWHMCHNSANNQACLQAVGEVTVNNLYMACVVYCELSHGLQTGFISGIAVTPS